MTQIHDLEIQQEFADVIFTGDKTFEVRYNDRGYQKGDLIRFRVMDGRLEVFYHELNEKTYKIIRQRRKTPAFKYGDISRRQIKQYIENQKNV